MESSIFTTDEFWSAVKRKAMSEVLSLAFKEAGFAEASNVAGETTRMTDAAIKRMREAFNKSPVVDEDVEEETQDEPNQLTELVEAVEKAVSKGKYKKAKKALKELLETGINGSEIDELKKAVKGLK